MTAAAILVVEDETLLRIDVIDFLSEAGFRVIGARNVAEAIRILETRPDIEVRLIFTDVDMGPGQDGLWLAAQIRDRWPPIQIIVASGHRHVTSDMLPPGSYFFGKHYSQDRLLDQIRLMTAKLG